MSCTRNLNRWTCWSWDHNAGNRNVLYEIHRVLFNGSAKIELLRKKLHKANIAPLKHISSGHCCHSSTPCFCAATRQNRYELNWIELNFIWDVHNVQTIPMSQCTKSKVFFFHFILLLYLLHEFIDLKTRPVYMRGRMGELIMQTTTPHHTTQTNETKTLR